MSESKMRLSIDVVFSTYHLVAQWYLRVETNTGFVLLLDQGWGNFLRTRDQMFYKFRRHTFACL